MYIAHVIFGMVLMFYDAAFAGEDQPHVHRTINKNGLHRELTTRIKIPVSILFQNTTGCVCMLKETLPSSVYVDYYELKTDKINSNESQVICPNVDTEKPEYLSEPTDISVITPELYQDGHFMITNVTLPFHIRYHAPGRAKERKVTIRIINPRLLLHCQNDFPCQDDVCKSEDIGCYGEDEKYCRWKAWKYRSGADQIHIEFPVGNSDQEMLILAATFFVVVSCVCLILRDMTATCQSKLKAS